MHCRCGCGKDLVVCLNVRGLVSILVSCWGIVVRGLCESLNLVVSCCVFCVFCVMGVKHHSPLGGKRCLGEGVSWAHTYGWETLPCEEIYCLWSMGVHLAWLHLGGIRKCVEVWRREYYEPRKGILIWAPKGHVGEEKMCKFWLIVCQFLLMVRAHLHPILDSLLNLFAKPWEGKML